MENKKIEQLNEQDLENVNGGHDDTKYAEGEIVKFVVCQYGSRIRKIGTVLIARCGVYSIQSGDDTYTVGEEDIIGPVTVETEGGIAGGW